MSARPHHDMGTCWCGELHAAEHVLRRKVEALQAALRRAIVHVKNMEMPDTGVVGPGGERELTHHEYLLAAEIREWEKLLG